MKKLIPTSIAALFLSLSACQNSSHSSPSEQAKPGSPASSEEHASSNTVPCSDEVINSIEIFNTSSSEARMQNTLEAWQRADQSCKVLFEKLGLGTCHKNSNNAETLEKITFNSFSSQCRIAKEKVAMLTPANQFPSFSDTREIKSLKKAFRLVIRNSELAKAIIREDGSFVLIQGENLFLETRNMDLSKSYCSVSARREYMNLGNGSSYSFGDLEFKDDSFSAYSRMSFFFVGCNNGESDQSPWTVQRFQQTIGHGFEVVVNE